MKIYEKTFRSQTAPGGERSLWEFPWPGDCSLTKLVVKQVGGENVAFTIDIFNARLASYNSVSSGGADPEGEYVADPDSYRVVATQDSDAPGKMVRFWDYSEVPFTNRDNESSSRRVHRIYIEIEPEGAGDKTWDVTLCCVRDVG